jgi:mannitol/fructose-specific phosphotransferase system IIA component (Ntr-type)
MKLSEIIPSDGGISAELKATEKAAVIEEMVDLLISANRIEESARSKVIKALMDREELGSTGIGGGVAVPHAKNDSISDLICAVGRSKTGVNFDALDGEPVFIVFLLLSSKTASGSHLEALAFISRLVRDDQYTGFLRKAKDEDDIRDLLSEADGKFGN